MTKIEAKKKLKEACALIFEVESQIPYGEHPRVQGYQARIKVGDFDNLVRQCDTFTGGEY